MGLTRIEHKVIAILTIIGMLYAGWMVVDARWAKADDVHQLRQTVHNAFLDLKMGQIQAQAEVLRQARNQITLASQKRPLSEIEAERLGEIDAGLRALEERRRTVEKEQQDLERANKWRSTQGGASNGDAAEAAVVHGPRNHW